METGFAFGIPIFAFLIGIAFIQHGFNIITINKYYYKKDSDELDYKRK